MLPDDDASYLSLQKKDLSFFPIQTLRSPRRAASSIPLKSLHGSGSRPSAMTVRQAPLKLDFLIIGAGIGGLATAYALACSGHRVRVFEKLDGSRQDSVGVRIPPNLSKILYEWGLHDALSKASRCRQTGFHSMATNELVGTLEWKEDVIKETGGDFLLLHYADFYAMLYDLAVCAGASITFNAEIVSISVDEEKGMPMAMLADGTLLTADLMVGTDGCRSVARKVVTGQVEHEQFSDHSFFTIVIPVEKLKSDPDWGKWVGVPAWPIWMGSGRSLLLYPIRGGREYSVHLYWPHSHVKGTTGESWASYCPTNIIDFDGVHPSIPRLFSMVPEALRSMYVDRQPLEDWVDQSGTVLLIGEAAHPLMPFTIHNASLAVEDAAVLGSLMSHVSSREQVPQLLEAYQDLRVARVKQVQETELKNAALVTHADPEVQKMRDAAMRQSLSQAVGQWTDEQLSAQWDEIGATFGYDAADAAEDWWIKWGALADISREHQAFQAFSFAFQVTQSISEVAA